MVAAISAFGGGMSRPCLVAAERNVIFSQKQALGFFIMFRRAVHAFQSGRPVSLPEKRRRSCPSISRRRAGRHEAHFFRRWGGLPKQSFFVRHGSGSAVSRSGPLRRLTSPFVFFGNVGSHGLNGALFRAVLLFFGKRGAWYGRRKTTEKAAVTAWPREAGGKAGAAFTKEPPCLSSGRPAAATQRSGQKRLPRAFLVLSVFCGCFRCGCRSSACSGTCACRLHESACRCRRLRSARNIRRKC